MSATNTELPRCQGFFGRIFGHKFQGRYSVIEKTHGQPDLKIIEEALSQCDGEFYVSHILDSLAQSYKDTDSAYMGDVCVRCGLTINQKEHASNSRNA